MTESFANPSMNLTQLIDGFLEKNPLNDIRNTRTIRHVVKNGVVYSGEDASRVYDRRLGMDRPITRRDFLNGVRIAAAGSRVGSSGLLKAFGA